MTNTPHQQQITRAIEFLCKKDKKLAAVIKRVGPLNYRSQRTGFAALVKIIVGQQLSGTVAEAIYKKLGRVAGGSRVSITAIRKLDDAALRSAGLSNAKVRAVRDLIDKIDSGQLTIRNFNRMTDDEIAASITQVKGLGPWSAQMYLMFVLQRLDIFAPGDLGIQKALTNLYGLDRKKADFESIGDRWKPYRTIACWYLWASLDNKG